MPRLTFLRLERAEDVDFLAAFDTITLFQIRCQQAAESARGIGAISALGESIGHTAAAHSRCFSRRPPTRHYGHDIDEAARWSSAGKHSVGATASRLPTMSPVLSAWRPPPPRRAELLQPFAGASRRQVDSQRKVPYHDTTYYLPDTFRVFTVPRFLDMTKYICARLLFISCL